MASIINRPNGHRWIQFVDQTEKRQTIRLGKTNEKHAQEVCCKVEALIAAKTAGNSIDQQTAEWLVRCQGNPKRQFFVDASVIYDCIEQAPCIDWETIIALCRFGGLRCPTEVIGLMWNDVNLAAGEMVIRAPKTEHSATGGIRVCPIFPELRPYLEEAWDIADDGATRVISRYSNPIQNLRTQFERIITRAGHQTWLH